MADWRAAKRTLWLALACVLVLVRFAAAAEPSLSADFDGDGHRDRAVLDHAQPSVLHVWLSSTNATATIRSQTPIVHIAATDLDGDRRSELIAGDHTGLKVWTRKQRGFTSYRPSRPEPADLAGPTHRAVDDGPTDSQSAVTSTFAPTLALTSSARPRAPAPAVGPVRPDLTSDVHGALSHPPFAPRPPPQFA